MAVQESLLERILEEAERLSQQDRVRLIQRLREKFLPPEDSGVSRKPGQLEYGKYKGQWEITEEDFKAAEWYAADGEAELDDP
jgi:hypothetical protein